MSFTPTPEQEEILKAPLGALSIIACPGSGKTATAVRRMLEVRRRMTEQRGYALLLSHSNVAVDNFRSKYREAAETASPASPRVWVDTMDAFLVRNVIRPHAARVMQSMRSPFLIFGGEPFLSNMAIVSGKARYGIGDISLTLNSDGEFDFFGSMKGRRYPVDRKDARGLVERVAKMGAYTHETGRMWGLLSLLNEPILAKALARRYPQIIVDEAQDTGDLQHAILQLLAENGSTISLVGDPNQSIFEFSGATGAELRAYGSVSGVSEFTLTMNRRSVPSIIDLANRISGTGTVPHRSVPATKSGAFFFTYNEQDLDLVEQAVEAMLLECSCSKSESIILCRGTPLLSRLRGGQDAGAGTTKRFARSAMFRDRRDDIGAAFFELVSALSLILSAPKTWLHDVTLHSNEEGLHNTRRLIWAFLREPDQGLPSSDLKAKSQWLPLLKKNIKPLLESIEAASGISPKDNWGMSIRSNAMLDEPLMPNSLLKASTQRVRACTVHKVKGEEHKAVVFLATTKDLTNLIGGTATEEGRIAYVAVTRARDVLLVGIPKNTKSSVKTSLIGLGFAEWGK